MKDKLSRFGGECENPVWGFSHLIIYLTLRQVFDIIEIKGGAENDLLRQ